MSATSYLRARGSSRRWTPCPARTPSTAVYAAGVIDCVGGTLDGALDLLGAGIGQTRKINITVFAPNTPGDYSNQSIVDPANAIAEGNEFNNNSTIVTKVRTTGDGGKNAFNELTISKTQTAPAGQQRCHQQRRDLRDRGSERGHRSCFQCCGQGHPAGRLHLHRSHRHDARSAGLRLHHGPRQRDQLHRRHAQRHRQHGERPADVQDDSGQGPLVRRAGQLHQHGHRRPGQHDRGGGRDEQHGTGWDEGPGRRRVHRPADHQDRPGQGGTGRDDRVRSDGRATRAPTQRSTSRSATICLPAQPSYRHPTPRAAQARSPAA